MWPNVKIVNDDELPEGVNARNWACRVQVKRSTKYRAAVVAQEAFEAMQKCGFGIIRRIFRSKSDQREMEYMGHEIEVQAKIKFYRLHGPTARLHEAEDMQRGYDDLFAHMSTDEVGMEMAKRRTKAIEWVNRYESKLRQYLEDEAL